MDKLVELLSVEDYKKAIENKSIIVFSTSWCPDCHFMKTYSLIIFGIFIV